MNKFIAILLALAMILSLTTVAYANSDNTSDSTFSIRALVYRSIADIAEKLGMHHFSNFLDSRASLFEKFADFLSTLLTKSSEKSVTFLNNTDYEVTIKFADQFIKVPARTKNTSLVSKNSYTAGKVIVPITARISEYENPFISSATRTVAGIDHKNDLIGSWNAKKTVWTINGNNAITVAFILNEGESGKTKDASQYNNYKIVIDDVEKEFDWIANGNQDNIPENAKLGVASVSVTVARNSRVTYKVFKKNFIAPNVYVWDPVKEAATIKIDDDIIPQTYEFQTRSYITDALPDSAIAIITVN